MEFLSEEIDPSNFKNEIIEESVGEQKVKTYWLTGIHCQCEKKNQNGRIYPKPIIEREIKKLNDTKIKHNRFLSELSHPQCFTKTAKILTDDGWKFIKDISEEEVVCTLNTSTNQVEYHQITKKINEPYNGTMYEITQRNLKTTVTPNHRFLIYNNQTESHQYLTAKEIEENNTKYSHWYIPKLGNWVGEDKDVFILNGVKSNYKKGIGTYNIDPTSTSKIDMSVFVRFLGIWLAEGYVRSTENNLKYNDPTKIGISQFKEETKSEIRELLSLFPPEMKWKEYVNKRGTSTFILSDLRLATYLRENCGNNCYNKKIPQEIKQLSAPYLEELFWWFHKGDGRNGTTKFKNRTYPNRNVFTVSETLIHDLNEILFKSGGSGNISVVHPTTKEYKFADHIIKPENKHDIYVLNISTTKGVYIDHRFLKINKLEDYNDFVYCVEVPNQNFYCMDNGKTFWSGNSCELNFDRVSHITTSLVLEGNDGIGRSKILNTPCGLIVKVLMDDGVSLGMSTRGVGSLKESIVQNDYNLSFIDIVSDPSCADAWVSSVMESKKEWVLENGILTEKDFSQAEQEIDKIIVEHKFSIEDKQAAFTKLFNEVLANIKKKYVK